MKLRSDCVATAVGEVSPVINEVVNTLLSGAPLERIHAVLQAPTTGSLTPSTLQNLYSQISLGRAPWPASVECDDLEWAAYLDKLARAISQARKAFRGKAASALRSPSSSEAEGRLHVAICGLYLHGVAVAQQWSPDYEDDAIELLTLAVQWLDMRTKLHVVLFLYELSHMRLTSGWAAPNCYPDAILMLISAADSFAASLIEKGPDVARDHNEYRAADYEEWRNALCGELEAKAAELEIKVREVCGRTILGPTKQGPER